MKKFSAFLILFIIGFLPMVSYGQITPGSADNFITTWNTQETNEIIILTLGWGYHYDLYWQEVDNPSNNGELLALNASARIQGLNSETEYRVEISGDFPRIYINNDDFERDKLVDVSQWGTIQWSSMENAFLGCSNMDVTATDVPDLSGVKSCHSMFERCKNLVGNEANWNWNTGSVTDMHCMFGWATSFNQDIGDWDVSNVTTMSWMFTGAGNFNQYIGDWDVSSVANMEGMFNSASSFNRDIGSWDVSNVTNLGWMFRYAPDFNQYIGDWDVSRVTNMSELFRGAHSFNQDIGSWDVSKVTAMRRIFNSALSFNQDIGSWDVSAVTSMYNMFRGASSFNQDIGEWDVSSVTAMEGLFSYASSFNQDIGEWDLSNVNTIRAMFRDASSFNQDLSSWNVKNVIIMLNTFYNATSFNQDLSSWDISGASIMSGMLSGSGMGCSNYSATLIGWADQSKIKDGMHLGAEGLVYGISAVHAREEILVRRKGWDIKGDEFSPCGPVSTSNLDDAFPLITVFPNPSTNLIRMSGEWDLGSIRVEIYNTAGVKIGSYAVDMSPEATIDISKWKTGVYIIRITLENTVQALKFLKL